jgi:CHAT domain-containing protein/Tfp pilus assembly protein PilF
MNRRGLLIAAALLTSLLGAALLAQGPDLRKELDAAFQKGLALQKQGKAADAIPFFDKAVTLAPKVFGPDHANVAGICRTAAAAYFAAGRPKDAESLYRRSVEIFERIPNSEAPLAIALGDLCVTLEEVGKYEEAERTIKRSIGIQETLKPRDDVKFAVTLSNYGVMLIERARFADAEGQFKRALALREAKLGRECAEVADSLDKLGTVYRNLRRDKDAEAHIKRAMEIRKAKFGPEDISVSESLIELGNIHFDNARFQQAEKLALEALRIREKRLGKDHPDNSYCLRFLGLIYSNSGRIGEAEALYLKSLAMLESRFGPEHAEVAVTLSNMSGLYKQLGRYDRAEKALLRCIAIREKTSPNNPELSTALNNLGSLYQAQERLKDAKPLLERAIELCEKRFGKDHIRLAAPLSNLAVVHRRMGNADVALSLLYRAQEIEEDHYGAGHPNTATVQNNIAMVYRSIGKFAEADKRMERSIQLLKNKEGDAQASIATGLQNRAGMNMAMGRVREALDFQSQCLTIYQAELRNIFAFSSEDDMHAFMETSSGRVPNVISIALQSNNDAEAVTQALNWTLRLKGVVFDTVCRYRQAQQNMTRDDALQAKVARLRSQKAFLANVALNPPPKDAPTFKKEMDDAQNEVSQLEKELTQIIARTTPDVLADRENITTAMVQKRLPADGALIEFLRMPERDFKTMRWQAHHYFAFVLTPGQKSPRLIDLGSVKEIDAGVEALRKEFIDFQEKLKDCESPEEMQALEKAQEKQFAERSAPLYKLLFAPLRKELGKAAVLYLAPDGALNRLPFEAVVDTDGKYLVESYRCAYVSSGRDLLRTLEKPAKGTIVFADPDFKLGADDRLAHAEKLLPKKEPVPATRGQSSRELRSAGWKNLPGAAAEARDIQKLLKDGKYGPVKAYVGPEALEEVLKAMPAPRVLHLATHGFFLDREADDKVPAEEGAGAGWARGRLKRMDNPLLRSGIVLAGANTIGDKEAAERVDDGWVTAEEIALLNLRGTELVVLSACQTGLGDIKTGEGVQGLRRAFLHAGAQTLVTSLFEVPDTETRDLMKRFYTGIDSGTGKLRALHSAQRGVIDERRKTQGAAHPFFWASFVLVGNPD